MHSLLQISDEEIVTYHLSLPDFFQDKKRSGKYHIHPLRIALVRLPQKIQKVMIPIKKKVMIPIGIKVILPVLKLALELLEWLGIILLSGFLVMGPRLIMAPLFVIPGIFYANRHDGFDVERFLHFILWYPLYPSTRGPWVHSFLPNRYS